MRQCGEAGTVVEVCSKDVIMGCGFLCIKADGTRWFHSIAENNLIMCLQTQSRSHTCACSNLALRTGLEAEDLGWNLSSCSSFWTIRPRFKS